MLAAIVSSAVLNCGTHSAGPTALESPPAGAVCMANAFRRHCTPATYTLSIMGVDTIDRRAFRIASCRVLVDETFRVVPQPPHVTGRRTCTAIRRTPTDVIATGCTGDRKSVSLTH